jgi:hypothetical protein
MAHGIARCGLVTSILRDDARADAGLFRRYEWGIELAAGMEILEQGAAADDSREEFGQVQTFCRRTVAAALVRTGEADAEGARRRRMLGCSGSRNSPMRSLPATERCGNGDRVEAALQLRYGRARTTEQKRIPAIVNEKAGPALGPRHEAAQLPETEAENAMPKAAGISRQTQVIRRLHNKSAARGRPNRLMVRDGWGFPSAALRIRS